MKNAAIPAIPCAVAVLVALASACSPTASDDVDIHRAARKGRVEDVKMALRRDPDAVNRRSASGDTALELAVRRGHGAVVDVLLAAGADPNARSTEGDGPLSAAAEKGRTEIAKTLLTRGANPTVLDLVRASSTGHTEVMELLIDAGVDVNGEANSYTPLIVAARNGRVDAAELLLDRGAEIRLKNQTGRLPAVEAASSGHLGVLQLLLDRGADPSEADSLRRDTPLAGAERFCRTNVIQFLKNR